ncbi:hypothetical protein NQ038_08585 [Brevibacterium sp. 50QC2O2]|jgi:hypothetical protein|uniref:hypothetical protein n=1 Tax=Brevibacterium TaxID=1696 RepID=UPI00211C50BA|nr:MULTISPECIES: hypothetical protein [unclassified Brevibacterium]MCQ9367997.1 hypothetical protein [Brevibacterium sp. 91QC2O2]MCQ9387011.1 hypothetical protein [Brevibacterium sp. 68QC2CO]MCQ9388703.1 hypothetical protein [Brevibacterium sp. 50QC2O2]
MPRGPVSSGPTGWRSPRVLRPALIALWCLDGLIACVLGWITPAALDASTVVNFGSAVYGFLPADSPLGALTTGAALAVGVLGLVGLAGQGVYGNATGTGTAWGAANLFGVPMLGAGAAAALNLGLNRANPGTVLTAGAIALCGLVLVCLPILARRGVARLERLREHTKDIGTRTTARVAKATRVTLNDVDRWKIWLEYQDAQGQAWHITHVLPIGSSDRPQAGHLYSLTYDPAHPGSKSRTFVHGPVGRRIPGTGRNRRPGRLP